MKITVKIFTAVSKCEVKIEDLWWNLNCTSVKSFTNRIQGHTCGWQTWLSRAEAGPGDVHQNFRMTLFRHFFCPILGISKQKLFVCPNFWMTLFSYLHQISSKCLVWYVSLPARNLTFTFLYSFTPNFWKKNFGLPGPLPRIWVSGPTLHTWFPSHRPCRQIG